MIDDDYEISEQSLNKEIIDYLKIIHKNINNSKVLNGGFDDLSLKVNQISFETQNLSKKLDETNIKIDKTNESLNDPEKGLFTRVNRLDFWRENYDKWKWAIIGLFFASIGGLILELFLKK